MKRCMMAVQRTTVEGKLYIELRSSEEGLMGCVLVQ